MRANDRRAPDEVRRRLLQAALAGAAMAAVPSARAQSAPLIEQPEGGFRFLPGSQVFAGGAVAREGFEIVHAVLRPWLPLEQGYALIERHLGVLGRPMRALCGMELRLPRQLSMEEFRAFNQPYVQRLIEWGLLVDGRNPVSRTNVAPAVEPPEVPSLHGFSYAVRSGAPITTFVMSGITEIGPGGPVAAGDTSAAGMREKMTFVIRAVTNRLRELGLTFRDASQVEVYLAQTSEAVLSEVLMPAIEEPARRGVRWHFGRPPITGVEVELEARGVLREILLAA
ncbi:MAG: hypothetical protein K2X67_14590 [Burkholderiales bacterium]|nr:hypothetical protein [Burkholderiales bacterium]